MRGVTPDYTLTSLTQPTRPPQRRTGVIVAVAVAGVVLLVAAVIAVTLVVRATSQMTVHGSVAIRDTSSISVSSADATTCGGNNGYDDLVAGAPVNITDAAGATVALGQLNAGRYDSTTHLCTLQWTVKVPTGKKFYGVAVGRRPALKLAEAQMHQPVELSIG